MRSCLSPWARASPWGNGSGLSGSANHEPPTPPSDLGRASPRPRTRPEPRLSATRCPGGGERTQPSPGPCSFPSSPARHARPLATVTLRGAKPVGRLRLHLRRQSVLEPCAQQSRSLSSRRYPVQVLIPRGGARGAEPKGQPALRARPLGQ